MVGNGQDLQLIDNISVSAGEEASHDEPDALRLGSFGFREEHNPGRSHHHRAVLEREEYKGFET